MLQEQTRMDTEPQSADATLLDTSSSTASDLLEGIRHRIFDQRPGALTYAHLSQHVYQGPRIQLNSPLTDLPDAGWQVIDCAYHPETEYFGALYQHEATRQLVLVHRGTNSLRAWLEDFQRIVRESLGGQQIDALDLTQRAVVRARTTGYQLSFSGHSLGAWLAEHSLFYCVRVLEYGAVHAVTFEGPGSQSMVESHLQSNRNEMRIALSQLDLTEYLSYPNVINTYSPHWGSVYQLSPELETVRWRDRLFHPVDTNYTAQSHFMEGQVDELTNGLGRYMEDWPAHHQQGNFFKVVEPVPSEAGRYRYATALQQQLSQDFFFDLYFGAHYAELSPLSSPRCLPLRQIKPVLQDFLQGFYEKHLQPIREATSSEAADLRRTQLDQWLTQQGVADETTRGTLLGYTLKALDNRELRYLEVAADQGDAHTFRARLSAYFYAHPGQLAKLRGEQNLTASASGSMIQFGDGAAFSSSANVSAQHQAGMTEFECTPQALAELMKLSQRTGANPHTLFARPRAAEETPAHQSSRPLISVGHHAKIDGSITATRKEGGFTYKSK